MQPSFKRRRRPHAGPTKNELKVRRREEAKNRAAQQRPLGEAFPGLARLSMTLQFTSNDRRPLDEAKRDVSAADVGEFTAECPGRCRFMGLFDLEPRIKAAVAARETSVQASELCQERI